LFEEFSDQISTLDFWVAHGEIDLLIVHLGSLESRVRSVRRRPQVQIDPIPLIERDQRLHIPFRSNPTGVHAVDRYDCYQVDRIGIDCVFQIRSRYRALKKHRASPRAHAPEGRERLGSCEAHARAPTGVCPRSWRSIAVLGSRDAHTPMLLPVAG
jgi:hypothetical protein